MPNLRIVRHNLADAATIVCSPTPVSDLDEANLKTDIKSQVCRVTADAAELTVTFDADEAVGCVAIPACTLGPSSTIRVRLYDDIDAELLDTGVQDAAPGVILENWDFGQSLNVNAFADWSTVVAVWFERTMCRKVVIDIEDDGVSSIDISRLVVGSWFEARYQAELGSAWTVEDTSTNVRAESGDIRTDRGTQHRVLTLNMDLIASTDRHQFADIIKRGIGERIFVAVSPDNADVTYDQDWRLYGTVVTPPEMTYWQPTFHQTQLQIQEW